jgi:hypothetical protein
VAHAGALVHAIACLHQGLLVFVHEARPALGHDHDLKIGLMPVPTRAFFWRMVRLHKVRNHFAVGGVGNPQVLVKEEIPQPIGPPTRVLRADMGKFGRRGIKHGASFLSRDSDAQTNA